MDVTEREKAKARARCDSLGSARIELQSLALAPPR